MRKRRSAGLFLWAALVSVASCPAGGATPTIDVKAEWGRSNAPSYMALSSGSRYKVCLPDESVHEFVYDAFAMPQLKGPNGWVGEIAGDYIVLKTNRKGSKERILFKNGKLLSAEKSGTRVAVDPDRKLRTADIHTLWPDITKEVARDRETVFDIWGTSGRLRLWFVNPDDAGIFLAHLALLAIGGFFFVRARTAKGVFLVVSLAFVWLVFKTESRGAFLAFLTGLFAYCVFAWSRFRRAGGRIKWRHVVAAFVLCCACLTVVLVAGGKRFGRDFFKQDGDDSRLPIWQKVPHMIVDAPGGWGWDRSGKSYIQWYGDLRRQFVMRGMIGCHQTILVEVNDVLRICYLMVCFFVLASTASAVRRNPMPAAVLFSYFVAAGLNPVYFSGSTWIIPLIAFSAHAWGRPWKRPVCLCACAAVALLLTGGVVALVRIGWGHSQKDVASSTLEIRKSGPCVFINGRDPEVWLVDDRHYGYALSGFWYTGREIRSYFLSVPHTCPLAYVSHVGALPQDVRRVVVAGLSCEDFVSEWRAGKRTSAPAELLFLSPPFGPDDVPDSLRKVCKVRIVTGEFAARMCAGYEKHRDWVEIVPGCELYIPDWVERVVQFGEKNSREKNM